MFGACDRDIHEHIIARIHQRHHGAGKSLAQRVRRAHRYLRGCVDPQPTGKKVPQHRRRKARKDGTVGRVK
jgi:hypothetical protein